MTTPFARLLVPLDGSPDAERALGPALDVAVRTGLPLTVLRQTYPGDEESAATYLAELTDRYADRTDLETTLVNRESAVLAITEGIEPGTLVCMGTHGRGRSEALLGSVAEAVLRDVGQPLLLVGPHVPSGPAFESGHVVACLDGSKAAEGSLGPAQEWSDLLGLPLWLVTVGDIEGVDLNEVAGALGQPGHATCIGGDDPAEALADLGDVLPVALLVMTTHGRTGWRRLTLGSVLAATVREAHVPVLVVPAVHATE
jgi:nucleotide-binding universal stress UspA family protein